MIHQSIKIAIPCHPDDTLNLLCVGGKQHGSIVKIKIVDAKYNNFINVCGEIYQITNIELDGCNVDVLLYVNKIILGELLGTMTKKERTNIFPNYSDPSYSFVNSTVPFENSDKKESEHLVNTYNKQTKILSEDLEKINCMKERICKLEEENKILKDLLDATGMDYKNP
jgi:hypothetical protein